MSKEKLVLAYSGGLDTSVLVHWLMEQGYEVIALCLDLGQSLEDLEAIRQKGLKAGAVEVIVQNVQEEFVRDYILPAIQFNAVYEGTYLLGTSLARPLIAKAQIETAAAKGATAVGHGATGKGNDQVRFELSYLALNPKIKIVAPWKMPEFFKAYPGRSELMDYAQKAGIPVKATKQKPWSTDENMMHISYESGVLEDPWLEPPEGMCEWGTDPEKAPDTAEAVEIEFDQGVFTAINGQTGSLTELFHLANQLGAKHGIGRVDMVESRFVGMKSRGVYETPGGTLLHIAHRAMESITLDRDVIHLKDTLMPRFARLVYNGFWFTPEMRLLLNLARDSQITVTGKVRLKLYKGQCTVTGRQSEFSLYDEDIATMEKDQGEYNPEHATGFIRLNALPLKAWHRSMQKLKK